VYRLLGIFHNFSPFGITDFTAFAVLQGVRGSLLQLHALRLATAAKSAIADFRFYCLGRGTFRAFKRGASHKKRLVKEHLAPRPFIHIMRYLLSVSTVFRLFDWQVVKGPGLPLPESCFLLSEILL